MQQSPRLPFLTLFVFLFTSSALAQEWKDFKIFATIPGLSPPGIYGLTGTDSSGTKYLYPAYGLSGVFTSSYPLVAPNGELFVRFETNAQGTKLVVRKTENGDTLRTFAIAGYNPQWFADGKRIFYETAPGSSSSDCWSVDVTTGDITNLATLDRQFFPPANPSGAAVLSPDDSRVLYMRSGTALTPYVKDLRTNAQYPFFFPDSAGKLDHEDYIAISLSGSPAMPLTMRHMQWSPDGRKAVLFGQIQFALRFPPDTTLHWRTRTGIFVVNPLTRSIVTIYQSENFSVDHPERFYFTPGGREIVLIFQQNNRTVISIASATQAGELRQIAESELIYGGFTQDGWPISPISHDGGSIVVSDREDGGIQKLSRQGGIVPLTSPRAIRVAVNDAQWIDFSAKPPVPKADLSIAKISPIQVLEDVPLVAGKPTMVRVFLNYTGPDTLEDVTVELRRAEGSSSITLSLRRYNGKVYCIPDSLRSKFEELVELSQNIVIGTDFEAKGYTSFNFTTPLFPTTPLMSMTAIADVHDKIVETDEDNNVTKSSFEVKPFFKPTPYKLRFTLAKPHGLWNHKLSNQKLAAKSSYWAEYIQAVTPIPKYTLHFSSSVAKVRWLQPLSLIVLTAALDNAVSGYDRTIYIMPERSIIGASVNRIYGASYKTGAILVDEMAPQIVAAHELGHTYGLDHDFIKGQLEFGNVAGSGWDVLNVTRDNAPGTRYSAIVSIEPNDKESPHNYYSLMGTEGETSQRVWVTRDQYSELVGELVQGGMDPPLMLIRGEVRGDEWHLRPTFSYTGILPLRRDGPYTARLLDINGNVLDSAGFAIEQEIEDSSLSPVFVVPLELKEQANRIVLVRNDTVIREITRSANNPSIEIHALGISDGKIDLRLGATDLDGDSLSHAIFYSPDGNDWLLLVADTTETEFEFDREGLAGSRVGRLMILTTDGFNTTNTTTWSIDVPDQPVLVDIEYPVDGDTIMGGSITVEGFAYDPQTGILPDSTLKWYRPDGTQVGTGKHLMYQATAPIEQLILKAGTGAMASADTVVFYTTALRVRNKQLLSGLTLQAAYPNPFESRSTVSFFMEQPSEMQILLRDILGRTLLNKSMGWQEAGEHQLTIERTLNGVALPSGTYWLELQTDRAKAVQMLSIQ